MPCLILTGHPCSGKSTFAKALKERALAHESGLIERAIILNEESVCVNQTKAECYATSQSEKATRSALKAALDKSLAPRTLVILDSMNYIKGYRYELHCLSKAVGERHGVIWVLNSVDTIRQWNRGRYPNQLMDELIQRFEPPDARNRWDKPLYRIDLTPTTDAAAASATITSTSSSSTNQAAEDALQRSVYNMHSLSDAITDSAAAAPAKPRAKSAASSFKKRRPSNLSKANKHNDNNDNNSNIDQPTKATNSTISITNTNKSSDDSSTKLESQEETTTPQQSLEERIDEILDSFLLDVAPLKEGMSTQQNMLGDANVLHQVDSLTQNVCNSIIAAQSASSSAAGICGNNGQRIDLTEYGVSLRTSRTLGLPELKRLRQQYIRWVAQHPPADASERGIVTSFARYVEGQV